MEALAPGFAVRRYWSPLSSRYEAELDYQNQVRDHAADESGRPDKLLRSVRSRSAGFAGSNGPSSPASTVLLSCSRPG